MTSFPRHRIVSDVMTTSVHVASPLTPFKLLVRVIEENRISAVPVVDQQGKVLGEHKGVALHTVGQRRGLEIGRASCRERVFGYV